MDLPLTAFQLGVARRSALTAQGFSAYRIRRALSSGRLVALESGWNMLDRIAHCRPLDEAVAVFDSAVRQGRTTLAELREVAEARAGRFREVGLLTSEQADSGLESLTRVRLSRAGIPCREQVVIDGHPVDLLIGRRLVLQLDGAHHGTDAAQLARDRRQDRRLRRMGYTVLRYGYTDVVHSWPRTLAEILSLMAQRAPTSERAVRGARRGVWRIGGHFTMRHLDSGHPRAAS